MAARLRCQTEFCQAWIRLNEEEEARLAALGGDLDTTEILCIACGVRSVFYRQDLISSQLETFYSLRPGSDRERIGAVAPFGPA